MRSKVLAFLTISMCWSGAQAHRCGAVLSEVAKFYQLDLLSKKYSGAREREIQAAMAALDQIPKSVLRGEANPNWQQFDQVRSLRLKLLLEDFSVDPAALQRYRELMKELEQIYTDAQRLPDQKPSVLSSNLKSQLSQIKYGPTDYKFRQAFREELVKLYRQLPETLRTPLLELPVDGQKAINHKIALEVVKELEHSVLAKYQTSGFQSPEALREVIETKGNPDVKRAAQQLDAEDFEFAILRPENARWWVPKVGFHNQHVTGTSRGYLNNMARDVVEASHLDVTYDDFQTQDKDLKPKYGLLIPKFDSGLRRRSAPGYGSDMFILNKDRVRDRTTWTAGDSLNSALVYNPQFRFGVFKAPVFWDQFFIPWSQRLLLAPLIQKYEHTQLVPQPHYMNIETDASLPSDSPQKLKRSYPNNEYVELQFWGELGLDDVKAFVFQIHPPSGDFLTALLRHKIPIYESGEDMRTYKPWTPAGVSVGDGVGDGKEELK